MIFRSIVAANVMIAFYTFVDATAVISKSKMHYWVYGMQ